MGISEAKKQAIAKYRKNKVKQVSLSLFPPETDIIDYLAFIKDSGGQVSKYIKELIRDDLKKKMKEDESFKDRYLWFVSELEYERRRQDKIEQGAPEYALQETDPFELERIRKELMEGFQVS